MTDVHRSARPSHSRALRLAGLAVVQAALLTGCASTTSARAGAHPESCHLLGSHATYGEGEHPEVSTSLFTVRLPEPPFSETIEVEHDGVTLRGERHRIFDPEFEIDITVMAHDAATPDWIAAEWQRMAKPFRQKALPGGFRAVLVDRERQTGTRQERLLRVNDEGRSRFVKVLQLHDGVQFGTVMVAASRRSLLWELERQVFACLEVHGG